ncbi:MAG: arginyltransferase [Planctomycetes bacterium]|nr:arginyltransferase [Planctomycetota bacterium]
MRDLYEFTADPERCPYLPDRDATMTYRVVDELHPDEYDRLLESGWRRFGSTLMAPVCEGCRECVPIRLRLADFRPTRQQRRTLRANTDIEIRVEEPTLDPEHVRLYLHYHEERSRSRGWPAPSFDAMDYVQSFLANATRTLELQFRLQARLVGVAYVGESARALNAIYAYFDPGLSRRSLGTLNVLRQIEIGTERSKTFVYLGYWVRECRSMTYKARFRPHELFDGRAWRRSDAESAADRDRLDSTSS